MKYFKKAEEVSDELAEILIHNKYLLEDVEQLKIAIFVRMVKACSNSYRDGVDALKINDISNLVVEYKKGEN